MRVVQRRIFTRSLNIMSKELLEVGALVVVLDTEEGLVSS
jgi:hypothetical protein